MGFSEAVKKCFVNYVGFTGRARRAEFWWWTLFVLLVDAFLLILLAIFTSYEGLELAGAGVIIIYLLFSVAVVLPGLAVAVRRLHDIGMSGWWYLIVLVPVIGPIIPLIWFCLRGTRGRNRFGSDPLGSDLVDAF